MSKSKFQTLMICVFILCVGIICTALITTQQSHQTKKCSVVAFVDGELTLEDSSGNLFAYTYDSCDMIDFSNVSYIDVEFDTQNTDEAEDDEILSFNSFYSETGYLLFSEY